MIMIGRQYFLNQNICNVFYNVSSFGLFQISPFKVIFTKVHVCLQIKPHCSRFLYTCVKSSISKNNLKKTQTHLQSISCFQGDNLHRGLVMICSSIQNFARIDHNKVKSPNKILLLIKLVFQQRNPVL